MAGQGDIKAAGAFVELYLKDNAFTRGLAAAEKKLANFGRGLAKLGGGTLGAGLGIAGPLGLAAKSFADYGSMVGEMAERTGLTTDQFQELAYAAKMAGVETETLAKAFKAMSTFMTGDGAASDLAEMKLTLEDFKGLDAYSTFMKLSDAIGGIDSPANRTAMAMKVFSKSGFDLIPMLASGSAEIKKLGEELDKTGNKLSGEQVQSADALGDAYDALKESAMGAWRQIGSAVGDVFMPWIEAAKSAATTVSNFIKENRELAQTVAAVGVGLMAGGAALLGLSGLAYGASFALAGVSSAMAGVAAVVGAVGSVLAFTVTPLGLLTAGLGTLAVKSGAIEGATGVASNALKVMGETATTAWDGIKAAFGSGDLAAALEIATSAASAVWTSFTAGLEGIWNDFTAWISNAFGGLVENVEAAFELVKGTLSGLDTAFGGIGSSILSFFGDVFDGIWDFVKNLDAAWNAMMKAANEVEAWFGDIGSGIEMVANEGLNAVGIRSDADAAAVNEEIAKDINNRKERVTAANLGLDNQLATQRADRAAKAAERNAERDAKNAALDAEAKAAREALKALSGRAALDAMWNAADTSYQVKRLQKNGADFADFATISGGSRAMGTFSAAAASRLGEGGGTPEKILEENKKQNDNLGKVIDAIKNGEFVWM